MADLERGQSLSIGSPRSARSQLGTPRGQATGTPREACYQIIHSWMSRKFLIGVCILFPLAVTFWICKWFLTFFDDIFSPVYYSLFKFHIFGLGFITSMAFILAVGVFFSSWLGALLLDVGEWIIKRLPLVRHIYSASKQVSAALNPENEAAKAFQECVLIRHPRKGEFAFGFITGHTVLQTGNQDIKLTSVYVPTNHVYIGDVFLLQEQDIIRVHPGLSVREGLETVISVGMTLPNKILCASSSSVVLSNFDAWFNSAIASSFATQGALFEPGNRSRPQLISQLISRLVWGGFPTATVPNVGDMHWGASHPVIQPIGANLLSGDPLPSRPTVPLSDNNGSSLTRQATLSLPDVLDELDSNMLESRPTLPLPSSFHQRHSYYAELPDSPTSTSTSEASATDTPAPTEHAVRVLPQNEFVRMSQQRLAPRPSTPVISQCDSLVHASLSSRCSAPQPCNHSSSRFSHQHATSVVQHRFATHAAQHITSASIANCPSRLPSISSASEGGTETPILPHTTPHTQPHALLSSILGSQRSLHAINRNPELPWLNPETQPLLENNLGTSSSDGVNISSMHHPDHEDGMDMIVPSTRQLLVDQAVQTSCGPHGGWASMIDQVPWRYTPSTTNQTLPEDVTTNSSDSVTSESSDTENDSPTFQGVGGNPVGEFGMYQRMWDRITTVQDVDTPQSGRTYEDVHINNRAVNVGTMQDVAYDLLDEQIRLLEGAFNQEGRDDEAMADAAAGLPNVTVYGYGSLLRQNPHSPNPHVFAQARQIGHVQLLTDHLAQAAAAETSEDADAVTDVLSMHLAQTGSFADQATNTITTARGTTHHVAAGTTIPINPHGQIRQYWQLMPHTQRELADTSDDTQPLLAGNQEPHDDDETASETALETAETAAGDSELQTASNTLESPLRGVNLLARMLQRRAQQAGINVGARQPSWAGLSAGSRLQRSAGYQEHQSRQARVRQLLSTRHWTNNDPPDGDPLHGMEIPAWAARFSPGNRKPPSISPGSTPDQSSKTAPTETAQQEPSAHQQLRHQASNEQQGQNQGSRAVTESISFSPGTSVSTTSWPAPLSFASPFLGWRSAPLQMSETVVHGPDSSSHNDEVETTEMVDRSVESNRREGDMAVTDSNADSSVLMASIGSHVPSPTSSSSSRSSRDLRVICTLQVPTLFPSMTGNAPTCTNSLAACTLHMHNQGDTSSTAMETSATAVDGTMARTSNMSAVDTVHVEEIQTVSEPPLPTLFLPRAQSVTYSLYNNNPLSGGFLHRLDLQPNRQLSHSLPTSPMHRFRSWLMSNELWRRVSARNSAHSSQNQHDIESQQPMASTSTTSMQSSDQLMVAEHDFNPAVNSEQIGRWAMEAHIAYRPQETAVLPTETATTRQPDVIPLPRMVHLSGGIVDVDDVEAVIHLPDLSSTVNGAPMARRNAVFYRDGLPPEIAHELGLASSLAHPLIANEILDTEVDSQQPPRLHDASTLTAAQSMSVQEDLYPPTRSSGRYQNSTAVQTALPAALQPLSAAVPVLEHTRVVEFGLLNEVVIQSAAPAAAAPAAGAVNDVTVAETLHVDSIQNDHVNSGPSIVSEESMTESMWGPTGSEASSEDANIENIQAVPQMSIAVVKALMSPHCIDCIYAWTHANNVDMTNGYAAHMLRWLIQQATEQNLSL